jgi:predicted transcriptional regulator
MNIEGVAPMPKRKIAIAISDWLLEDVDERAAQSQQSRSALIEEVLAEYVSQARSLVNDEEYQRSTAAALEDMKRIAREYAEDPASAGEPSSLELLRQLRGTSEGTDSD